MSLVMLLDLEATTFVYGLAFVVVYELLTSRINMKGLFIDKSGSGRLRPERVQLLIATVALASKYLVDVSSTTMTALPPLDAGWLYLFGGSSGVYVARKLYERFSVSHGTTN
jgi:hypothetical protein